MSLSFSTQTSLFDSTFLSDADAHDLWGALEGDDVAVSPQAEPIRVPRIDFRFRDIRGLATGWKARAADTVRAIALLGELEREDRNATEAEQAALMKFTGFGAGELANNLFPRDGETFPKGWEALGAELHRVTSEEERRALARSTQYAHYTPEWLVRALWTMVTAMDFKGGVVLEPGCGSGMFLALRPGTLEGKIAFTAIENEPVTARIARKLFPNQWIRQEDFTRADLAERYELVIGNPPFSSRTVRGPDDLGRLGLSLHDYFIARAVSRLKPGGIGVFVTSRYTLDKKDESARRKLAEDADLLGAVRLPAGTMADEAGTEVVIDVLVFRRRAIGDLPGDDAWLSVDAVPDSDRGDGPLVVNRLFLDRPELVLGQHDWTMTPYGPGYTCRAGEGEITSFLSHALKSFTSGVVFPAPELLSAQALLARRTQAPREALHREGSYLLKGGALFQIVDGLAQRVAVRTADSKEGIYQKQARIVSALVPVRDAARAVLRAQMENLPYARAQGDLKRAYQNFVRQFGPINQTLTSVRVDDETGEERETQRRPNLQPFYDDPDVWLVSSIEDYDEARDVGTPGPIFSERVVHAPTEPAIHSAHDALAVCLHEQGVVELPRIAELFGASEADTLRELGDAIYLDAEKSVAGRDVWVMSDELLSGPVRTKLTRARDAARHDPRLVRTVRALEEAQPEDLRPSDITARLGAPWLPVADIEAFIHEVIGIETTVWHTREVASWTVAQAAFQGNAEATSTWGTERRHAGELLDDALNQASPKIYDVWRDENGEHRELNTAATEAAKEKLAAIRQAFSTWVWNDGVRAERLVRAYNEEYNNLVPRQFDGAHLRLPGASPAIGLRPHQKRVIWRIIASGNTYMAHAVGAGKTFSMVAAVMEQKRLGLIGKAMITVPGHCLAQMAREFMMLYPNARILVADETNFIKAKRQRFLARAATGTWDAIIITHDAFKFIPVPAAFEEAMIQDQIASYESLLNGVDKSDRLSVKRIERMKEGMEAKLEGLAGRKDDLVHLGEIGVDQILVDEAQQFRKLAFATNQSDLKGIDPNGSQRAWDMFVKTRYLEQINPGRQIVMASGSPITNTLGEMMAVQRFMQLEVLTERGLHEFDAWAANFGETRTELELQPSGLYKPVTRFAEFVNVADLMSMYRSFADVVMPDDLRRYVKLPAVRGGKREIVVAPGNDNFKAYQKVLAARIKAIEARKGKPEKGQDILLSVITDARHASIDLRFVTTSAANDDDSKLNIMIRNVLRIWQETSDNRYSNPETGQPYELPGAVQMVFSDLGTVGALENRGFSAYLWIRDELIRFGVPREQIAFMQDYKKSATKQRLFGDLNAGRKRILIGSTATMGTGVNAQQRLKALHHLDVPWLVADIVQREGRIERQGNQHDEIELYAYAQQGSVDATNWQLLERKNRFICLAMSGDRSIRRIEDVSGEGNQFAMAKALASGDERLMQLAGLEADVARLERLAAAHYDDQFGVKRAIERAERDIAAAQCLIPQIDADIVQRRATRGEAFVMETSRGALSAREKAGAFILSQARMAERGGEAGRWTLGTIGGFAVWVEAAHSWRSSKDAPKVDVSIVLPFSAGDQEIGFDHETAPLGVISKIEHALLRFESKRDEAVQRQADAERRLPAYRARCGMRFAEQELYEEKRAELAALQADLAATREDESEEGEGRGDESFADTP
ncbi:lactate dehydrogenase [Kozakia baliensis]|uniref:lactate dehydrogenase n=1 Tax=Kozakia baliensis TaxID=153496 RepID=UPI0008795703|nr:lactate dehydrogenase [Kozakia baliensis]AOX21533.1 lactate dehydrogenase [Kozakia baliensis]